jgi:BASS family bile acid:Na+ symporter
MTIDPFYVNVLVTVTLVEMMAAIGLGVSPIDLIAVARDWRLVARAMLANYVAVPAATVGLLLLFRAPAEVAAGFLILAVCPGAPYGPPLTALAKGDVPAAVGLMAVLAASSALLAPALLALLLPLLSEGKPLTVDAGGIVLTLLLTQLLPLAVGLAVRWRLPRLAERLQGPANLASKVLNLAAIVCILATQYPQLLEIRLRGLAGMLALLIASAAAGWLLGGPGVGRRRAMTLTTALRNVGVGLVIATGGFGESPAVTAVLAFGVLGVVASLLLATAWGRSIL